MTIVVGISETAEYLSTRCDVGFGSRWVALIFDLLTISWRLATPRTPRVRPAVPVRRLVDRFIFNWDRSSRVDSGSTVATMVSSAGMSNGTTPEQLEKQVPVGEGALRSSRENKLASSQLVAGVKSVDQLNN